MAVMIKVRRGAEVAKLLHHAFATTGIHGHSDMPEEALPAGIERGSPEHVAFITLTVSIDYQRDAGALWDSSRRSFEDAETRYLFDFRALQNAPLDSVVKDMQRQKLSGKPQKDACIWRAVGTSFASKWFADPLAFLESCAWDSPRVLRRLESGKHLQAGRLTADFPYLKGPKIGPLWLRMLRDNVGVDRLQRLEEVPIPVDVHVARATLAVGVVRGSYAGNLAGLFGAVRDAWFQSVAGLRAGQRAMVALDMDEPLWHLSRYGCMYRDRRTGQCPLSQGARRGSSVSEAQFAWRTCGSTWPRNLLPGCTAPNG